MDRYSHRKAASSLTFKDGKGNPVSGQQVHFTLKNHEFKFGCNIFWLPELLTPGISEERKMLLEKYWDAWHAIFNFGTLPFYQGTYEPVEGQPRQESTMRAAKFLKENRVEMKGHPLCWHTVSAPWLMHKSSEEVLENQLSRIRREVTAFKGYIDMWDVINEVVIMPVFDNGDNAITPLCQKLGRVPLVKKVFDQARACNPDATLLLNDFNTSENYRQLIEDCLEAEVPIDVIGIQSHQHQGFWGLEKLYEVLERFSCFNKTIHFTENTFVSGDLMPAHIVDLNDFKVPEWPTTPEGEERQARDLMTMLDILFAHPLVKAFTNWDFTDGAWLGAPAGLVRLDGSPKPAYEALKEKITHDWHTEYTAMTDENGCVTLEGFKGEYSVSCGDHEIFYTLSDKKENDTVVIG